MKRLLASASLCALALVAALGLSLRAAHAETTVTVGVVNDFAGWNPYADSTAQMYMIWCQTYGCWMRWDWEKGDYTSDFFDSWKTEDDLTWVFHLKPGLKRSNGEPVVPADFVHTVERIKTDPESISTRGASRSCSSASSASSASTYGAWSPPRPTAVTKSQ